MGGQCGARIDDSVKRIMERRERNASALLFSLSFPLSFFFLKKNKRKRDRQSVPVWMLNEEVTDLLFTFALLPYFRIIRLAMSRDRVRIVFFSPFLSSFDLLPA